MEQTQQGVYKNPRLMHVSTSVVGHVVHLQTKDGKIWEGILSTFSPEFTICLDLAIQLDSKQEDDCLYAALKRGSQAEKQAFFDLKDIVRISVADVDLNYATKDTKDATSGKLATDSDISGFDVSKLSEHRELESWQDDGDNANAESLMSLDDANKSGNQNITKGWDAQDMFTFNQRVHNVKSTYDEQLSEYTVPVPKHQGKDWIQKRERAEALAKEIEGSSKSQSRLAKEDGSDCEEEKFSAVLRPVQSATTTTTTNTNTAPSTVNNSNSSLNVKNYPRQRSSFPTRQRPNNYQRAANNEIKTFHQKFNIGSPRPPRNQQQQQSQQPHLAQSQAQLQHPHQPLQHHSQPSNQNQHQPSHQHQQQQQHQTQAQSQSQPLKQPQQAPPSQPHPPQLQSNQLQSPQQQPHASPANRGHQQQQQSHQPQHQQQQQPQSQTQTQPQQQPTPAQPQPPPQSQQNQHPQQSQQTAPPHNQAQSQHQQSQQQQQHQTQPHVPQSQPTQVQNPQQPLQQQPQENTQPSNQSQQQQQSQQHQNPQQQSQAQNQQNHQKQDRATQSELVRKFKLNPNAKEFVYKPKSPTAAMQAAAQVNGQAGHVPTVAGAVMDPASSSSMSQAAHGAYYPQVPIFAHGIPPHQQQHPAAQFMPNHTPLHFQSQLHYMSPVPAHFPPQQMAPRYIRGQFQNYHPRGGENHNNVRPVYSQSSMMPATSTGQPYAPPPSGAPHPMNAYAASPQQPMIYGGISQSMYPVVQAGFPQHMPHVLPNPAPYDGSAVYMPPQNYVVNPH